MMIYYKMQAQSVISQPFPVAYGLRADGSFHIAYPGSWQLGHREQKWLRPCEGQQKKKEPTSPTSVP